TRRKFGRLAPCRLLLSRTRSDQVADHDDPCRNPDTSLQRSVRLEPDYRRDQLQPRAHRPLGVVLMGLRIAEVHEDTVAHVFRDEAFEAAHNLRDAFLIPANDLPHALPVHTPPHTLRTPTLP